uniref:DUF4220 domain-containing protein n=1 Tax=Davidia involucrata TaxID=16924 RepID=A0A5B7C6V9_DAVIN
MDPVPTWMKRLWDAWNIRMLILVSLNCQIILFICGNRRKYNPSIWNRIVVWLAYLTADSVAIVALSKLSDAEVVDPEHNSLRVIWAPLLLLHLGGPDTITAYALEDNQLWLRHFLTLGVQTTVAIYVVLMYWRVSWFSFLTFPVFVAGMIKYGERTWVLRCASDEQEQRVVPFGNNIPTKEKDYPINCGDHDKESLLLAHEFFTFYKPHIPNYVFSLDDAVEKNLLIGNEMCSKGDIDPNYYWDVAGVEMGLMYDMLYTKAPLIYTKAGFILRSICISFTVSVLVAFFLIVMSFMRENKWHGHYYWILDIAITGILLVGAFVLEMYAIWLVLSSDWTKIWLLIDENREGEGQQPPPAVVLVLLAALFRKFPWLFPIYKERRWCNSMGQFNPFSFFLTEKITSTKFRLPGLLRIIEEKLNEHMHKTYVKVPEQLKKKIITYILSEDTSVTSSGEKAFRAAAAAVTTAAAENTQRERDFMEAIEWIKRSDFDEKIIICYIVTKACYHDGRDSHGRAGTGTGTSNDKWDTCKFLSDYLVYLLVFCPSMLPDTIKDFKFRNVFKALKDDLGDVLDEEQACKKLRETEPKGSYNPLLKHAKILVQELKHMGDKCEILSSLWLEMLFYAANECQQNSHAQHVRRGGELLTLVWLLITHSIKSRKAMTLNPFGDFLGLAEMSGAQVQDTK